MTRWPPTRPRWSILWLLWDMHENIREINRKAGLIMTKQEDLDARVAQMNTSIDGIGGDLQRILQELKDAQAAGEPVDLTVLDPVVDRLKGLDAEGGDAPEQPQP